eukprot:10738982-Alexandrium_andersonii.AAC.1
MTGRRCSRAEGRSVRRQSVGGAGAVCTRRQPEGGARAKGAGGRWGGGGATEGPPGPSARL